MKTKIPSLLGFDDARAVVLRHVRATVVERVVLGDALGCRLAAPVVCDMDYPPFDRAMMDGFAIRAGDVVGGQAELRVVGAVAAGSADAVVVGAGQTVQINTGAPVPHGADAVVPVEQTETTGEVVRIDATIGAGQHIAPRGAYVRSGDVAIDAGVRMGPGQIAAAAACGASQISVYKRPSVAALVTGNELVDAGRVPSAGQIRDSNGPLLAALIGRSGCVHVDVGRVGDDVEALNAKIAAGLQHDVMCITGGVSMGTLDLVPECLVACGATVHFHRVAVKPGKPILFATGASGCLVFALPGNPVSAFVTFALFVAPALAVAQGGDAGSPDGVVARLCGKIGPTGPRKSYRPASVCVDVDGNLVATAVRWGGSGDPFGLARANGLIVTQPGAAALDDGAHVRVVVLDGADVHTMSASAIGEDETTA